MEQTNNGMSAQGNRCERETEQLGAVVELLEEVIDLEEYALSNRKPPHSRHYIIRVDKKKYRVDVTGMTGRELLKLAGKIPPERYMVSQKYRGGQASRIGLDERADFTASGVERFMTLPLDQTEG